MSRFVIATTTNSEAEAYLNKGTSPQVVFASGVTTLDATSGSSGTDNTAALQAVLDTASASAPLTLVIDGNTRTGKLRVKSHTAIIGIGMPKMWLKNGADSPFIQNYNPSDDTITDVSITIQGVDLECNRANQTGIGDFLTQEANGNLQDGIQMWQVRNLTLKNVIVRHARAIAIHYSGTDIHFDDIQIDNNDGVNQQGGIQCEGPSSNITYSNIRGSAFDDLTAFAVDADQWNETAITGLGPYVGPGDITDVTINGILGYDCWSAVRLFGWTGDSRIDRISVSNIAGTYTGYPICCRDVLDIGSFSVDGVDALHLTGSNPLRSFVDLSNCVAETLRFTRMRCRPVDARPLVNIDTDCVIKELLIELDVFEDDAACAGMIPFSVSGTIGVLEIRNSHWYRDTGLDRAGSWLKTIAGADIGLLKINNVTASRCSTMINKDAGTIDFIQACAIRHEDSGSGTTIRINGGTVNDIVMSNWYGYAQTSTSSGGVITLERGDAFDSVTPPVTDLEPDDETGLVAWSNPSTLGVNGSAVSSWTDSSSSSHPFAQSTSGNRPTVVTSELNGFSVVRFDGTNDFLVATPTTSATRTIFVVAKKRSAPPASTVDLVNLAATTDAQLYVNSSVSSNHAVYYNPGSGTGILSDGVVTGWRIFALVYTNAFLLDIYVDGAVALSGAQPGSAYLSNGSITLGSLYDGTLAGDWDIAEVFVYDEAKDSGIVAALTLGLQNKYAL